tara:strand:- start:627 stop:1394 length:768 start_codon:yes stop_codon:yes gene_type:complete
MRIEKIKLIREKLKNNIPTIGSWQQIPNPSISEILGNSGYDWVAIDFEHGSIDINQLPDMFRALELSDTLPLVRLASSDPVDSRRVLDAGAGGVIIPMVENLKQIEAIRDNIYWPPNGIRGVGYSRANLFGKNFKSYKKEASLPLLIAQIENKNAVENLDQILKLKGLDAIMIGPYDLSASMGITGDFDHQNFIDVMKLIKNKCKKYKVPFGNHIVQPNREHLKRAIDEGQTFIPFSIDAVFLYTSASLEKEHNN